MDNSQIKDKIRKLLNLSSSPVEAEAQAALLKARELMMKYKLSEMDIDDKDPKDIEIITINTEVTFTKYTDNWIASLASTIAENHCCQSYFRKKYRAKRRSISFMGAKEDAELVEQIFYYARYCIYSTIDKLRVEYGAFGYNITDLRPMTDSYAKGFIHGLKEQYDLQNQKNQEWGLVAVVPQEVKDYIDSLQSVDLGYRRTIDQEAYAQGQEDGMRFTIKDKISSEDTDEMVQNYD